MSNQFKAFIRQALAVGITTATMQWSFAEPIKTLDEAFAKVERYQNQSDIGQQRQSISELNIKNSGLWQNPSLNINQDGFGSNTDQELSIAISQPLDVFGQRKLNQKLAETAHQQGQLQQQLWTAQSQLVVKFAWSQLALAQVEKSLYAAQLKVSQNNLDSAKKRYQAGSIALVDYERAQIESLDMQRLYQQAVLAEQVAQRQLSNLWGETKADIQLNATTMPWPDQSDATVQRYIAEGWLEKLYALNIQQSNLNIESLKVQARPNPTLNVGMKRSQAPNESSDTTLGVGVDIPLNIFNRQQYSIPMAQRQQSLLNQQQQRELKQQILDIANAMHELKGLKLQFSAISQQTTLAEQVQVRTLQGFKAGKLSITDIQQANSQLQSIRLGQLQLLRQAWQTALSAEALSLGTSYEQISSSDAFSQISKNSIAQIQDLILGGAQ
ncbi:MULTISPECIES: TolC family protein [Acinetobacter]|uniref:TolC family protein n=1 Tax=Acinetobacter TaxID=469 RepID=UPI000738542E|nr:MULTISPECIES: TolC family protein [Acinetobacter]AXF45484.1 TolC family protein [Acinetobacter johnsonii]KUG38908.1 cation transporter [Acinetobacter johnsonii]MDH1277083.1 TolC family protein [Acinetobacter johnsonii]MDH1713058.1 TolC family protein [Acinetobacter johnsonii]MDQ8973434.1 TolC family protein [Acinetobacter johnsonii]